MTTKPESNAKIRDDIAAALAIANNSAWGKRALREQARAMARTAGVLLLSVEAAEQQKADAIQAERTRCADMLARLIVGWSDSIGEGMFYQALCERESAMRDGTEAP